MENESDYEIVLKRLARICGIGVLLISAYFSYDGFDQNVTGGNTGYTNLAKGIGIVMCLVMSLFQFILSSRYNQLNPTLKMVGFASYIYSIYTTYLGAVHIMGMSNEMALAVALLFDIAPEPAIAWSFGDSLKGDLVSNLGKTALGVIGIGQKKSSPPKQHRPEPETQPRPQYRPMNPELMERMAKSQGPHQMQERRDREGQGKQQQGGRHQNNRHDNR